VATTTVICRRISSPIQTFSNCCTIASVIPRVLPGLCASMTEQP
jgi:hypothetical protein